MKYRFIGIFLLLQLLMLSACGSRAASNRPLLLHQMDVEEFLPGNPQAQVLAVAAAKGDIKRMDKLVAEGADVNARGASGTTLSAWLLLHPNIAGFRHLMELGADPNILWDWVDKSLIHRATFESNEIGTEYLQMAITIGNGNPNLEKQDGYRRRPIGRATHPDRLKAFAILYNAGAEIDFWGPSGHTLVGTTTADHFKLTYFLLEHGVNYQQKDKLGFALHYDIQFRFDRNSHIATDPASGEYIWFWRCVDFLEKRGEVFNIPSDATRPTTITAPAPGEIFAGTSMKMYRPIRSSYMHEVNLVYPTPTWISPRYEVQDFKHRQQFEEDFTSYEFVPKKDSFDAWHETMSISGTYAPGTSLGEYAKAALHKHVGACALGPELQVIATEPDHNLYYFKCTDAQMIEGYLYVGQYKDTFVSVLQAWQISDKAGDPDRRAKALEGTRKIEMKEGIRVVPKKRTADAE